MRHSSYFHALPYLIFLSELLFVRKPKFARLFQDLMKDFLKQNLYAFGKGKKAKMR